MFQTFTGSSRRPRQVNLSGRNTNPFAAVQQSPHARSQPNAVSQAQQERKLRQQERQRLDAAQAIQKTWRGHTSREAIRRQWRREWDERWQALGLNTSEDVSQQPISAEEVLVLLRQLLLFVSPRDRSDWTRVAVFSRPFVRLDGLSSLPSLQSDPSQNDWTRLVRKLLHVALAMTSRCAAVHDLNTSPSLLLSLLDLLLVIVTRHSQPTDPSQTMDDLCSYYNTIAGLLSAQEGAPRGALRTKLLDLIYAPLAAPPGSVYAAYQAFCTEVLTKARLSDINTPTGQKFVMEHIIAAMTRITEPDAEHASEFPKLSREQRRRLLQNFIVGYKGGMYPYELSVATTNGSDKPHRNALEFMRIVYRLLSGAIDISTGASDMATELQDPELQGLKQSREFLGEEVSSLLDRIFLTGLLSQTEGLIFRHTYGKWADDAVAVISNYMLLLFRIFPAHKNNVCTLLQRWRIGTHDPQFEPRPKDFLWYLWASFATSDVFKKVVRGSKEAVEMMRTNKNRQRTQDKRFGDPCKWTQAWRIGLLFLELYAFTLRVIDDDEFMQRIDSVPHGNQPAPNEVTSLDKTQIQDLSTFLKNLAFALYWSSSDIRVEQDSENGLSLAQVFGNDNSPSQSSRSASTVETNKDAFLDGLEWASLTYVKGLVTGLLRALYERDSRRPFLPKDHWLMAAFDIKGLIPHVVAEQEYRFNHDEEADLEEDDPEESDDIAHSHLVGTARSQQHIRAERARRLQERAARKKTLESVTPRLEILQNMPFFIPFSTRVEIFREFVAMDQRKRRGGVTDPDQWRMMMADAHMRSTGGHPNSSSNFDLSRHAAKIQRTQIFQDAFEQFYELGPAFKEPIQITFVDQFNAPEPGIDGGGVTKEFLTSVVKEAFAVDSAAQDLFVENEDHLLYPNPGLVDTLRDQLRARQVPERSATWNDAFRDLSQRYEFLGRIVGKCLYEGILVDVQFAPFFLVKWPLTGGPGFAENESSYKASINDLRALDKALYQGLLHLKRYTGDVERDFGLDFTITDTYQVIAPDGRTETKQATKSLTANLKDMSPNTPVTRENCVLYLYLVAHHRLVAQPGLQTRAFLRGLGGMVTPQWLAMFNPAELQTLLGGDAAEIDVADLRRHTQYSGAYALGDDRQEHPTVRLFWQVMQHDLTDAERRAVLRYVTSTPRGPLLGFRMLNPRFSIRDSGSDQARLPSTSTCVNLLKLPIYGSRAVLREKLMYAVNSGAGFDLS